MADQTLLFDFHGILVKIVCDDEECATFIKTDFSYFSIDFAVEYRSLDLIITVSLEKPPYDKIPYGTLASCHTKDAALYKNGDITFYDYAGETLVVLDHRWNRAEIFSLSRDHLYEKTYLMVMSRVGVELDRKRLHRIHAMGVVHNGKALLCLLPMGGGKTTLTLSLLGDKNFSLLSEEVPLVAADGTLYPFPIRMGVTAGTELAIPEEFLKPFIRSHYRPKTLIDITYFKDQIARSASPGYVFVGKRIHSDSPRIVRISKFKAFGPLYRLCVVGMGLPELLEYILRFDLSDIVKRFTLFTSRLSACLALLRHSETLELHLSYDRQANADLVSQFVTKNR
ncbi:MAG: hypothetical protein KAI75_08090 [Desulfobulbaceae bacterium]|nr:hypothetical protein [Desulfobulbaceae bacterium]